MGCLQIKGTPYLTRANSLARLLGGRRAWCSDGADGGQDEFLEPSRRVLPIGEKEATALRANLGPQRDGRMVGLVHFDELEDPDGTEPVSGRVPARSIARPTPAATVSR